MVDKLVWPIWPELVDKPSNQIEPNLFVYIENQVAFLRDKQVRFVLFYGGTLASYE